MRISQEMMMKQISIAVLAATASFAVQAGPVEIPNTFQRGTAAVAAEVNANFDAVESAVNDNAARVEQLETDSEAADSAIDANTLGIANNAGNIASLQTGLAGAGVLVRVDGIVVGRFLSRGNPPVEVEVAGSGGAETELVAGRTADGTADVLNLVSPTGYFLSISTTDFAEPPFGGEGTLAPLPVFYGSSDCTGQAYFAVEGPVGLFSTFAPGVGDNLPLKRWMARQGTAFRTSDPTAPTEAFMIRRGQTAQQVALGSLFIYSNMTSSAFCIDLANIPGHVGNETNSAFLVEALDPVETGITAGMAGEVTIGL